MDKKKLQYRRDTYFWQYTDLKELVARSS